MVELKLSSSWNLIKGDYAEQEEGDELTPQAGDIGYIKISRRDEAPALEASSGATEGVLD